MKNNRLLTALRYVGDPSRDGAAQYLIATASAQEVTQAYDVFVTTLEESYAVSYTHLRAHETG